MKKFLVGLFNLRGITKKRLKNHLKKNGRVVSYVLITCTENRQNGEIEVAMQYEGKKEMVDFLLNQAMEKVGDE
ncbi:MAG: hypothetical protein S4CHLAM102_15200 [Chlamydiia bacterium]|nr:hypothetical protein [Chlamydiia bacterium]